MPTNRQTTADDDRRHAAQARRNAIVLSREANAKGEAARQAWSVLRKTFSQWVTIGEFVLALRTRAEEIGGRFTFKRLMEQEGFEALLKSKAILSRLEKIMEPENLPSVIAWHQGLSEKEQIEWSSPSSVIKRCPVFAKLTRTPGKRPVSNLLSPALQERDRKIAEQQAYIGELEAARETSAMTLEQVTQALVVLLQDEPDKALKAAIRRIADKVVAAWKQRRRDGVPLREAPRAKAKAKGRKKPRKAEAIKELEADMNRALDGLFDG